MKTAPVIFTRLFWKSGTGLHHPPVTTAGRGSLGVPKRPSRRTAARVGAPAPAPGARLQGLPRTLGTGGGPSPAASPARSAPDPLENAARATTALLRGPKQELTAPRPPDEPLAPGRASKPPGPAPRHGGGAATGLTGPERRRNRPGSRSLPPPETTVTVPAEGAPSPARPGPTTHRPNRSPLRAAPLRAV